MSVWRLLWRTIIVAFGLAALSVIALFVYYRPTIEHGYVNTIDPQQHPLAAWTQLAAGLCLILLIVGALAWLRNKARKSI